MVNAFSKSGSLLGFLTRPYAELKYRARAKFPGSALCSAVSAFAAESEHRRWQVLLSGRAKPALCPSSLAGSLLTLLLSMCGGVFSSVLEVDAGREHGERVTPPRAPDGLVDTLRYLLRDPSRASRHLIRL